MWGENGKLLHSEQLLMIDEIIAILNAYMRMVDLCCYEDARFEGNECTVGLYRKSGEIVGLELDTR